MKYVALVAAAQEGDGGIGSNGALPWKLPTDMKFFEKVELVIRTESPSPYTVTTVGNYPMTTLCDWSALTIDNVTTAARLQLQHHASPKLMPSSWEGR